MAPTNGSAIGSKPSFRKETTMKRLFTLLAALVLSASIAHARDPESAATRPEAASQAERQALNITFDDEGFGYYGLKEGVIQLDYDVGVLTLHLVEVANPHGVTHRFAEIAKLERSSYNRIYQTPDRTMSTFDKRALQAAEERRLHKLINVSSHTGGMQVQHQRADFAPVTAYYLDTLAAEGFAAALEQRHPNLAVYSVDNGSETARIVFTRAGNTTIVRLTGVE